MANAVKVLIVEENGAELASATELDLTPQNIPFSSAQFLATDVQSALLEANRFGHGITTAESLAETNTTSTTVYSTKVTLNATNLVLGNYILFFACTQRTAAANRETDVRVREGGTTLWETRTSILRTQGVFPISGFVLLTNRSGNLTYIMDFKVGGTATTSYLKDARLALWRIS